MRVTRYQLPVHRWSASYSNVKLLLKNCLQFTFSVTLLYLELLPGIYFIPLDSNNHLKPSKLIGLILVAIPKIFFFICRYEVDNQKRTFLNHRDQLRQARLHYQHSIDLLVRTLQIPLPLNHHSLSHVFATLVFPLIHPVVLPRMPRPFRRFFRKP